MFGSIVAVLLLVFSLTLIGIIAPKAESSLKDTLCESTITMSAGSDYLINTDRENRISTACPTKYLTFSKDVLHWEWEDFTAADKPDEKIYYDPDKIRPTPITCSSQKDADYCTIDNINAYVAQEIVQCWNKFGNGDKNIFNKYFAETQCLLCAVVYFDAELKSLYGGEMVGSRFGYDYSLDNYMRMKDVPPGINQKKLGYKFYDYTLDFIHEYVTNPYYDYDMDEEYAIVLVTYNENKVNMIIDTLMEKGLKETILEQIGFKKGDEEGNFVNTIEFIETSELNEVCQRII